MITLIDLELGNLRSVINAVRRIGVEMSVATQSCELEQCGPIILPGVGSFEKAMSRLKQNGMADIIKRRTTAEKIPLIGICLGMQLLADTSEENGVHEGLGLIPGRIERLNPIEPGFRVPNIGWYNVEKAKSGTLFQNDYKENDFYFIHSFHFQCDNQADVSATINYSGKKITAAVERDSICGIQFHPEKSQDAGIDLLNNSLNNLKNNGWLR